jgi:glycosyltransferase involved in cell wall biosynthesis
VKDSLRILMLNMEYPPVGGGSSPVTRGLARGLVARGHRVDVVTMGYRDLPREEDDAGVQVFRVAGLRSRLEVSRTHELLLYAWLALRTARRLSRAAPYDICHAHFVLPTGMVPFALRRERDFPPYVITSHGSDIPGHNPDRFTRLHRFTPPLIRRILRASSGVLVPSAALERLIRQRFPDVAPGLVQIANGVDADRFEPCAKESRILLATRLIRHKGVHQVLEALATFPDHGHQLDVAGDGPERATLERQARRSGVPARFHGWLARTELDRLFERSRIFVLATASDNFPVSLLEAMAARCAIVATRAGGCPEVVGDAALLVDPGDVGGLRDALQALIRDPALAQELGERAQRRVRERFAWPAIVAHHEQVYRAVLAAGATSDQGRATGFQR